MKKNKIRTLSDCSSIVKKYKGTGKTVGLITGCFDILHVRHIELFEDAKKYTDILIVGVEHDETIKMSKGVNRPVNDQYSRMRFLEALQYIDYIFPITDIFSYTNNKEAERVLDNIVKTISPNFLMTNKKADRFWNNKEKRARKLGIKLLSVGSDKVHSTTKIVEHLLSEL